MPSSANLREVNGVVTAGKAALRARTAARALAARALVARALAALAVRARVARRREVPGAAGAVAEEKRAELRGSAAKLGLAVKAAWAATMMNFRAPATGARRRVHLRARGRKRMGASSVETVFG
jgi:hypothetical protein